MDTRVLPGIDDCAIDHFLALEGFAERLHEWPILAVGHIRRVDLWRKCLGAHCHDVRADRAARLQGLIADLLDGPFL